MYFWSTQLFRGNILTQNGLDYAGACQTEEGITGLDNKASLTGKIGTATGIETEHAHDGGDNTADLAKSCKCLGVAVKPPHPGRYEGTGRIVHSDDRDPLFSRHVEQPGKLVAVCGIYGACAHSKIVTVHSHIPAAYFHYGGYKRGTVKILAPVLVQHIGCVV